jgi:hypothetical protein
LSPEGSLACWRLLLALLPSAEGARRGEDARANACHGLTDGRARQRGHGGGARGRGAGALRIGGIRGGGRRKRGGKVSGCGGEEALRLDLVGATTTATPALKPQPAMRAQALGRTGSRLTTTTRDARVPASAAMASSFGFGFGLGGRGSAPLLRRSRVCVRLSFGRTGGAMRLGAHTRVSETERRGCREELVPRQFVGAVAAAADAETDSAACRRGARALSGFEGGLPPFSSSHTHRTSTRPTNNSHTRNKTQARHTQGARARPRRSTERELLLLSHFPRNAAPHARTPPLERHTLHKQREEGQDGPRGRTTGAGG